MKLIFPDPYWRRDLVSGAAFRAIHDDGMTIPLHLSVSVSTLGIDPFEFITLVEQ